MIILLINRTETLLNQLLSQDPAAMTALQEIAGKCIAVEFTRPDVIVNIHCLESGVRLAADSGDKPDVIIRGRPVAFVGLLLRQSRDTTGFPREMEITGDVALAQYFQQLMKNLDLDWEEYLSQQVGDTMAHKLGNLFRGVHRFSRETAATLGMDISEYLRFERETVPDQSEVDEFITGVDELRNDIERLKQRISRLENVSKKE